MSTNTITPSQGLGGHAPINAGMSPMDQASKNALKEKILMQALAAKAQNAGAPSCAGGGCGGGGAGAVDLNTPPSGVDPAEWAKLSAQEKLEMLRKIAEKSAQGAQQNMCQCAGQLGGCACGKCAGG